MFFFLLLPLLLFSKLDLLFLLLRTDIIAQMMCVVVTDNKSRSSDSFRKESDDLDLLGVTFDCKMTFEKHLRTVSRASLKDLVLASQSLIGLTGDALCMTKRLS